MPAGVDVGAAVGVGAAGVGAGVDAGVGAGVGAAVSVGSAAASIMFNPSDSHRERIRQRHEAYDRNRMDPQESSSFFGNAFQSTVYNEIQNSWSFNFARNIDDRVSTYQSNPP